MSEEQRDEEWRVQYSPLPYKETIFTGEQGKPQFIESPLLKILERIATAFEEQNHINQAWIDLQVKWHEAGDPVGKRIVEIHEKDAERNEQWREEMRTAAEVHALRMNEVFQATYEAYTASLAEQAKAAQKAEVSNDHTE